MVIAVGWNLVGLVDGLGVPWAIGIQLLPLWQRQERAGQSGPVQARHADDPEFLDREVRATEDLLWKLIRGDMSPHDAESQALIGAAR